jgi:hypothetical protein
MALASAAFAQAPVAKPACDRACLQSYVDRYLDAMLAHDPSPQLFAKNVKFTENGVQLPLGHEGLWFGMSGKGTYKFYVPDVETQQIAFIGTAKEGPIASARAAAPGATPPAPATVAVAIRLKIRDGLITEAEQLVIRPETNAMGAAQQGRFPPTGESVEKLGSPDPIFDEVIPEAQRASRDELIHTANYYFAGLQRNDAKGYYPFTDDALRRENGMVSCGGPAPTSNGCKKQFSDGSLKNIVSRIRDRRFVAVDRERGIVYAFGFFDHEQINWTWQLAELFKIENGKIRRIEAVFARCPYGMNSGWSTYEQGISEDYQNIR